MQLGGVQWTSPSKHQTHLPSPQSQYFGPEATSPYKVASQKDLDEMDEFFGLNTPSKYGSGASYLGSPSPFRTLDSTFPTPRLQQSPQNYSLGNSYSSQSLESNHYRTHRDSQPGQTTTLTATRTSLPRSMVTHTTRMSKESLRVVGLLGIGTFASVHLVEDVSTGRPFALKAVKKDGFDMSPSKQLSELVEGQLEHEIAAFQRVDHPFTVKLHLRFEDHSSTYFLLDACLGGSSAICWHLTSEFLKRLLNFTVHAWCLHLSICMRGFWYTAM